MCACVCPGLPSWRCVNWGVCVCVSSCVAACIRVPAVWARGRAVCILCVCLQPGVLVCVLAQGVWILVGVAAGGNTFLKTSEAAGRAWLGPGS